MIQTAVALALIALVYKVHLRSRWTAMGLVWVLWLLIPLLRRLLETVENVPLQGDPLVLVPFAGTLMIGLLEFRRVGLSRHGRRIVALFALGVLVGAPAGILADLKWFAYSSFAYVSCLAAVAIGYAERKDGAAIPRLAGVLLIAMPAIAIYGIYQYFAGLPSWDADFLSSVTVFDKGLDAPGDPGHWRLFSTLKHPDTLAATLAVAIVFVLAAKRLTVTHALALALLIAGLALTYVRGVWVALVLALLLYALIVRGAALPRLAAVLGICVAVGALGSAVSPTVEAVTLRAGTIADAALLRVGLDVELGAEPGRASPDDYSDAAQKRAARVQARVSTLDRLKGVNDVLSSVPDHPVGRGVGQPGNGYDLDNGYLLLIYQLGPLGAILVVTAIGYVLALAVRAARVSPAREIGAVLLAIVAMLIAIELTQDVLYGVVGAVFWYSAGWILSLIEESEPGKPLQPAHEENGSRSAPVPAEIGSGQRGRDQLPVGLAEDAG